MKISLPVHRLHLFGYFCLFASPSGLHWVQFLPLFFHTTATCPLSLSHGNMHLQQTLTGCLFVWTAWHTAGVTLYWVCVCWAFSELFIGQMILVVVCTCVIVPSVAFLHTVLWMPFLSASRVSSIGFTRTHRHTGHATHSFALSQALCVKQVDLCLLFLSADFFLFLSFYICHHLSQTQHTLSSKCVPTHMQIDRYFSGI